MSCKCHNFTLLNFYRNQIKQLSTPCKFKLTIDQTHLAIVSFLKFPAKINLLVVKTRFSYGHLESQEIARMQDFAPFTPELLGALGGPQTPRPKGTSARCGRHYVTPTH